MPFHDETPPPSYSEATSAANSGGALDEARTDGWVDGYVEAPRASDGAAEYRPPTPAAAAGETKKKHTTAAVEEEEEEEEGARVAADGASSIISSSISSSSSSAAGDSQKPRSRLAFGGLDLGGCVLGYGNGDDVGGWGVKIGPVLVGLVDVEAEKLQRDKEVEEEKQAKKN
ncbi:hypothetical protein IF1G_10129 [Cordyceps javanica]|uniref:Uncharacterized protein n=1 Tax=Cordyceps javanica TaxID=43265 RepID=A0A545VMM6_9HYPO|nr:hypothetical protein IF1G_10129 [Cordyceps javanica]TQW02962.1 hypothetical protein IF2G_09479 [Cordyceps javanica]